MSHRVAVNLTWLAPGRVGGSEEYLVRQLLGLLGLSDGDSAAFSPELYCTAAFRDAHPALTSAHPTRISPLRRDHRGLRIAAEHTWLAAATRHADLVHHGGGTAPLIGRRPIVVTVHDLQYLEFPHYFSAARRRYLGAVMPRSVRRAAVVATPSSFVRDTVIEAFGAAPDRVVVVPHGVPAAAVATDAGVDVRSHYGLGDRPYVVYPAVTHPHKGHAVLVAMLDRLPDVALVLIGGKGAAEPALQRSIAASAHGARVIRTGRVPDDHRDALIAGCEALVFPSEYEGFGAPLVEAMALGVPVVCSAAPAVREVVGDAGIVVERHDPADWAGAVEQARGDRASLVALGRQRWASFDLAASGSALAAAYRLAIEVGR